MWGKLCFLQGPAEPAYHFHCLLYGILACRSICGAPNGSSGGLVDTSELASLVAAFGAQDSLGESLAGP